MVQMFLYKIEKYRNTCARKDLMVHSHYHRPIPKQIPRTSPQDTIEFFYCHFLPNPTSIDIHAGFGSLWFECQYWQDSAMIWQKMTNYRKTLLEICVVISLRAVCEHLPYNILHSPFYVSGSVNTPQYQVVDTI